MVVDEEGQNELGGFEASLVVVETLFEIAEFSLLSDALGSEAKPEKALTPSSLPRLRRIRGVRG